MCLRALASSTVRCSKQWRYYYFPKISSKRHSHNLSWKSQRFLFHIVEATQVNNYSMTYSALIAAVGYSDHLETESESFSHTKSNMFKFVCLRLVTRSCMNDLFSESLRTTLWNIKKCNNMLERKWMILLLLILWFRLKKFYLKRHAGSHLSCLTWPLN